MNTIFITGGSRGIGKACVEKFAQEGWRVIFTYNNSQRAADELAASTEAYAVKCDVSSSSSVKAAIDEAVGLFGSIDVLVNNAGVAYSGLLQDMTDSDWDGVLNTDLSSVFYTSRAVIPTMLRKGEGAIINVASMWGVTGASCEVAYSAAKAGVIGFTKALAKELAPSCIRVNAVAPGAVKTDMMCGYTKEELSALEEETPLGRIGTPSDIADAVFFLASDSARFITGEVLNVNGGFVI